MDSLRGALCFGCVRALYCSLLGCLWLVTSICDLAAWNFKKKETLLIPQREAPARTGEQRGVLGSGQA